MSCCDPIGSPLDEVSLCNECGEPVDRDGDSLEVCAYSPVECKECGWAPCDGSC